jgi:iron(III) transport system permease protein
MPAALGTKRVRTFSFSDPLLYVQILIIALLCVLIVYPTIIILNLSLRDTSGAWTLRWFIDAYSNPRNLQAIWNTVVFSAGCAFASTVAGTFLAWAVVRTDMPGRRLVEMASIIPFISTPFIGALAWVLLASPEVGLINQWWRALGPEGPLVNIYSIWGIIFVESLYEMPFVFLMVAGALRSMDSTLEEASLSSGAGIFGTTLRVTLPLVLPAILGGALLTFVLAAEQFGVPAVRGPPAPLRRRTTPHRENPAR